MSSEEQRLQLIVERDGERAACDWARQTLQAYREGVNSPRSHASKAEYRALFVNAIRELETWLARQEGTKDARH